MEDLYTLVASVIESWATYDNCPCGNARREHAKFMLDFLGKEKTPDITEPLKNLKATRSGAVYEDQVITVLGVLNRVSKIVNESIFDIKRELAESREESEDCDEKYLKSLIKGKEEGLKYFTDPYSFYPINIDMEILKTTALLKNKKKQGGKANLEPVLGKATIDIMEKVDLLDRGKFDEWIKGIKEAVSVIHKIDKSDDDILDASTKLESILTSEQSLTFLRMLDSGLFNAVVEKIKNAKEGKFDEVIEKAEKVAEPKPDNVEKSYPAQMVDTREPVNFMQLSAAREFVHADTLLCKEA